MKKNRIFCLALLLLALTIPQITFSKGTVRLYLFYSAETGGLKVEEEIVRPLSQKYPIEVQSFSVNQLKNYDLLVKSLAEKGGTPWPSLRSTKAEEEGWLPAAPTEEERKSGKIIYAAFFYMPGCLHCEEMKADLRKWAARIPELRIRIFSLVKEENKKLDEALSQVYQVPESKRLVDHKLYMGEDYLWSEDRHLDSFQKLIKKYQGKGAPPPWEKVTKEALEKGGTRIIERFQRESLSAVLVAGFIDGINPCAFATIIFLVSYLTFAGRKGREIIVYGIVFT